MKTGMIEVEVDELNILNLSSPYLPFNVGDYHKVNWAAKQETCTRGIPKSEIQISLLS